MRAGTVFALLAAALARCARTAPPSPPAAPARLASPTETSRPVWPTRPPPPVELGERTWTELESAIRAGDDAVILMTASVEQNGPHLALDKHVVLGRAVALRVAQALGHTLVAPVLPFGRADEHRGFPGTFTLSEALYQSLLGELTDSLADAGFRRVLLMGDHGPNRESLARFAARAAPAYARRGVRLVPVLECYDRADAAMEPEILAAGLAAPGADHSAHAGLLDTSMLLAVSPDRVRALPAAPGPPSLDEAAEARVRDAGLRAVSPTGVLGDPRGANAPLGRRAFDALVTLCADEARAALAR